MFRYFSVVLICGFYGFASSAFANSQSATIPEDFRPHLIHHIQKQASSEYNVESRKAPSSNTGYQAKNAPHELVLGFGADGVDVRPEQGPEWRMGMKLSAIGYGEDLQPVASGEMTTSGNRVEVRYGNAESSPEVTEWYLNGPLGLEQGFTLNRPPAGKKQSGSLVLSLALSGDLTAIPNDDGREVRFQTTLGKTSLRFRDLYVLDATGRQLPSRFILATNGYGIQVDDRSAVYPISIDPLLIKKHQKLTAIDAAAGDRFGDSVAISGDTIVVGAAFDDDSGDASGSAYVFVRSGLTWTQEAKLTADDGAVGDRFGDSVAISGDTIVVGAEFDDGVGDASGSAYVFVRSGTNWSEQEKLTASDAAAGDRFGKSIAFSGDTIVVGAAFDDDSGASSGSAYVFVRSGTNWSEQEKLTASDAAAGDGFGHSVAISGDTIVVGATFEGVASNLGSAYVFVRSGTSWTQDAKLTAHDGVAGDEFGDSVATNGDTVVVGGPHNENAGSRIGSVYVFVRSGPTNWPLQQELTGDAGDDHFGKSVAISGDTVAVGANWDGDKFFRSGSAFVFVRSGTTWTQEAKLIADDRAALDRLGGSVSVSGKTVVMGVSWDDDAGESSGSAYVHESETFIFQGTLSGTKFCDDGLGTGVKEKFKKTMTFIVDTSQLPTVTAQIQIQDAGFPLPFELSGLALLKNRKSGLLQLFGNDSGSKDLSLSGKIELKKKKGVWVWVNLNGKFQFQDNGDACTLAGKFKAK
jgi:FG-GAP repeat